MLVWQQNTVTSGVYVNNRVWPKTMDYRQAFDQIALRLRNSSLEGASKPKVVSFCSSENALSVDMLFSRNQTFQFLAENHGLL